MTPPASSPTAPPTVVPTKRDPPAEPESSSKRDRRTPASPPPSSDEPALQVVLLTPTATVPKKGSLQSAGFDIAASEAAVVPPHSRQVVKTGLRVQVPFGCYGRVAPRSGLAVKKFVDVGAGVVDADYRGELGVVLFNFGDQEFEVKVGDRVAQLVLEKISMGGVEVVDKLEDTQRGEGGFGSTGVEKSL